MGNSGDTVGAGEWQGQTGDSWAAEWRRTDHSFAPLTDALVARGRAFAAASVLDIGCGAGGLAFALDDDRPGGRIIGLDISPPLVAVARERGAGRPAVSFEIGDAADWRPQDGFRPDLLVSRHGVMFFDRPVEAFAHLRGLAAPEGGLLFSCFRPWRENPVFRDIAALLPGDPAEPDPDQPGPFAFGDVEKVTAILTDAGWRDVRAEPFDFDMVLGEGEDAVDQAVNYFTRIGVASRAARALDDAARQSLIGRIRDYARDQLRDGVVSLPAAVWIFTASRS